MKLLILVFISGLAGSLLKILGGVLYSSNTLFVDAMTSFANIVSLLFILAFRRITITPPDIDHHYGHERYEYAGIFLTIVVYALAAGVATSRLYYVSEYVVLPGAAVYAIAAMCIYIVAILISLRLSQDLRTYGLFTVSELIEGSISVIASLGGAYVHFLVDYSGAILLTAYIFFEIVREGRDLINVLVDIAPSSYVYHRVMSVFKKEGLHVNRLRLRVVSGDRVHGDVIVEASEALEERLERARKELESMGIDLCIETRRSR